MTAELIRTIILVLVALVFAHYARRADSGSYKRRSFALASGGVALLALLNGLHVRGMNIDPLLLPMMALAVLLLAVSAAFLVQAWRSGEMRAQIQQVRRVIDEERERTGNSEES
jgi:hypothetical protein